jgi:lipid-A-disaccharide synthase
MRYYLIAGERSGDLHGGNLIHALAKKDPQAVFCGFGGDQMKAAGMDLSVHYDQMAFMGLKALVTNAWTIYEKIKFCKEDISRFKPDVIILIDYGGFNRRIAKFGKTRGIKTFYYIPPKVWAWYTSRAWELKRNVDRMFVILPFEKEFFKKFDFDVDYVGNPVLDAVKAFQPDKDFLNKNALSSARKIIALLPGSRKMELKKVIPLMESIIRSNSSYQFAVATVSSLPAELYQSLSSLPNVKLIYDSTYDLLSVAHAAIVTSGTATLETALFRVPQVVVYKMNGIEYQIVSRLVKVPYISLVNLIANREVVKELIQDRASIARVNEELHRLADDAAYRKKMFSEYRNLNDILDTGSASENAARLMIQYMTV